MSLLIPSVDSSSSAGKVSIFGAGGSGKSITASLLAAALAKERCQGRAVVFIDPESVNEFIEPIFKAEGVPLFTVPTRTFVEMRDALKEIEDADACVFVVDHYDCDELAATVRYERRQWI